MTSYCDEARLLKKIIAPYFPQQNGVIELKNWIMVTMAHSFLKEIQMPSTLWGEAICHSIYVLNRLPTRASSVKDPYEARTSEKPHIGHIWIFGCVSHMKIPSIHKKKLDYRSKNVVHPRKEPCTKVYWLYDPESNTVMWLEMSFLKKQICGCRSRKEKWDQPSWSPSP